jgi:Galactose oxidase, central domain
MNNWTPVGSLVVNRFSHSATLLPDGKVLLAMGFAHIAMGAADIAISAELYDPSVRSCSPTGSPFLGRLSPGGLRLPNNKVLVAGGVIPLNRNLDQIRSTELYDPQQREWYPSGLLNLGRQLAAFVTLQDGRVMITGGLEDGQNPPPTGSAPSPFFDSCEIYDPVTQAWTVTGSLNIARFSHTATTLQDGRVLVVGGYTTLVKNTPELYDPATGNWQLAGEPHHARYRHTATLLADGKVLVAGNVQPNSASAEIYDPVQDEWFLVGSLATGREGHVAVRLNDGRVLVQGGVSEEAASSAEIYDPANFGWTSAGSTQYPRFGHTLTLLKHRSVAQSFGRSQVLVAGGSANPTCEIFDTGGENSVHAIGGSVL